MSTSASSSHSDSLANAVAPTAENLPNDIATLKQMLLEVFASLRQERRDNQALRERLDRLLQRLYGRKTERFDPNQPSLFGDLDQTPNRPAPDPAEPTSVDDPCQPTRRARPHGRRRLPANLPRHRVHHELTEVERVCQNCGQRRIDIGVDTSEQLDYRPASLIVIEHLVHKYLCPCRNPGTSPASHGLPPVPPAPLSVPPNGQPPSPQGESQPPAMSDSISDQESSSRQPTAGTSSTTEVVATTAGEQPPTAPSTPTMPSTTKVVAMTGGEQASTPSSVTPTTPVVIAASKPTQPIPKGLPGPGLLAHLIVSKYVDHLPLYRLERVYERQGLVLPRSTTCDWLAASAQLLRPLYDLLVTFVLQSRVLHTDDTSVKTQLLPSRQLMTARLWTYLGDQAHPGNVFDFTLTRKRDGPQKFLAHFQGYLQADAFSGYDGLYLPQGPDGVVRIVEVACNAHARRRFYEARGSDLLRSHQALAYYRQLYELERAAKGYAEAVLLQIRHDLAVPILNTFRAWLEQERDQVLPKSPMGEAISYTLNNWTALSRYTEAGILSIDNNLAEREMKQIAIGRKNWLFFGSDQGGQTASILLSFTSTCKRLGIEPWAYLQDVLRRLPTTAPEQLGNLLPHRWEAARLTKVAATTTSATPSPTLGPGESTS